MWCMKFGHEKEVERDGGVVVSIPGSLVGKEIIFHALKDLCSLSHRTNYCQGIINRC